MKKDVGNDNCRNEPYQIGNQSTRNSVACFFNTNGTEIYGNNIKCSVSRTLNGRCNASNERIRTILFHGINHHSASTAAAQWFHQSGGQGSDKIGIYSHQMKYRCNSRN